MGINRFRLTDEKAKKLGLDLNKSKRYRLTKEQSEEYKSLKTEVKTESKPNDYKPTSFVLSAWNMSSGQMMNIDKYCTHYSLPRTDISSYKLVSHTGTPYYNIVFKENVEENKVDLEHIRKVLQDEIVRDYNPIKYHYKQNKEAVLKWADLHFGAHIRNLLTTHDYDKDVLEKGLLRSGQETNELGFKKVHVHINGDLIESFTGLNHINSWMSMDKDLIGSKAVMLCTKLLDNALSKIKNLGTIKIVAGNHDRLSKNNDEDLKGGAAELIAWGLELKGYDVDFHPFVTTHQVEGINHINLHGDKGISRKPSSDIILNYGKQGTYNFIFEAHLHSIIEKLSVSQRSKFNIVSDDSVNFRRMHLPSFFTGNYYSESLGYNSNSGYTLVWDNGKGKPNVLSCAV